MNNNFLKKFFCERSFPEKPNKDVDVSSIHSLYAGAGDANEEVTNFAGNAKLFRIMKTKARCNKLQKVIIIMSVWTRKYLTDINIH